MVTNVAKEQFHKHGTSEGALFHCSFYIIVKTCDRYDRLFSKFIGISVSRFWSHIKMLEKLAEDYAAYFKVDVVDGFQTVQDVIDNMLTRLEELSSVVHIIKLKNSDCNSVVSEDVNKYRAEITVLSKKVITLNKVVTTLQQNMDKIEKEVEKAETHFGVNNDNKLTSLLRPFIKRSKDIRNLDESPSLETLASTSVMDNFENNN